MSYYIDKLNVRTKLTKQAEMNRSQKKQKLN